MAICLYSTSHIKILLFLPLDTGVNKWSRGSRNAQVVVLFNFPTDNISNDNPYAYINGQIKILIILSLDTGVNKWSRCTRKAQNMVPFHSPTDNLSNDTPYAYINGQIKIHVFAIFLRFWALPTCATFGISTFEVS